MEWVVKLEAKSGWGEVETIEVGRIERRVVGLTADEVRLTLAEGKELLASSPGWSSRPRRKSSPSVPRSVTTA